MQRPTEITFVLKCANVLTDVTFFALFCFVAQADFKSVDFTRQVTETKDKYILSLCKPVEIGCWKCELDNKVRKSSGRIQDRTIFTFKYVIDSLKDKLLCEDWVLPLPRVCFSHLDAVQVDVTVGVGEILHWQLVGLLHIQHQAAHLREKINK